MTKKKDQRDLALHQIIDVLENKKYSSRDEDAFVARLVTGTVERAIELDAVLGRFSKIKVKKMHPVVRNILRMGLYELYYMDSVPARATVDEAVRLTKKNRQARSAGFVNAVLRRASREERVVFSDPAAAYSMPQWILDPWLARFGKEETIRICESFFLDPPMIARRNQNGTEYIQDRSSMKAVEAAGLAAGEKVLDVCAAPGGKTIYAADLVGETGHVTARDKSEEKAERIRENIRNARFTHVSCEVKDAREFCEEDREKYDVVIADLPCSGLGVLKRKPEIKYRLTQEDVRDLAALQRQILDVVWQYVRPGGRLVYSTCTIREEENEANAEYLAETVPSLSLEYEKQLLPDETQDGFYIARFDRH